MSRFTIALCFGFVLASVVATTPAAAYQVFNGWWCLTTNDSKCENVLGAASAAPEDARDPLLCRFGAAEAGGPVLLAATREDCTRAGGTVMTPEAGDASAGE